MSTFPIVSNYKFYHCTILYDATPLKDILRLESEGYDLLVDDYSLNCLIVFLLERYYGINLDTSLDRWAGKRLFSYIECSRKTEYLLESYIRNYFNLPCIYNDKPPIIEFKNHLLIIHYYKPKGLRRHV